MKEKLSKLKDILVFALSFEVNVILTLFLFDVDMWGSLWQIGRINIAVLFLYAWLWFIDLYLNNYSTAAVEEKRRLAKEGIYVPGPAIFEKRPKPEPKPKPVYVQPEPKVVYEQPKPQPVVQQPQVVAEPLAKPHSVDDEPQFIQVPVGEPVNIKRVVEFKPEPIVEQPKPQPIVEQPKPQPVVEPKPQPVVEEVKPVVSNREQLMAWIQEEENKESE